MKKQVKEKKNIVGYVASWLKNGIYAVTNISMEILMYVQIFILGSLWIQFNNKKPWTNKDRYFDETNGKSGNYCK